MALLRHWLSLSFLIFLPASLLQGVTIAYDNLGTFTSFSYTTSGVTVIGSNTLNFLNLNGLGVVGGSDSIRVDPAGASPDESLDFFADGPDSFASFLPNMKSISNLDGNSIDSFTVEAFDSFENSIGTFDYSGTGIGISGDDVLSRIGVISADQIKITASGDAFILGSIEFTPASAIPEPETYGAFLGILALGWVVCRRFRSKLS